MSRTKYAIAFALALVMALGAVGRFGGGPNGFQGATRRRDRGGIMQHEGARPSRTRTATPAPRARRVRRVARLREDPARGDGYRRHRPAVPLRRVPRAERRLSTDLALARDFVANEEFITMDYSDTGDVTGTLVPTNDIVIPPGAKANLTAGAKRPTSRRRPPPSRRSR